MNFGALPPEVNSGRMYAGAGAGPMMAAAAAWDALAVELGIAAAGYESVISELASTVWIGPASLSMAAAVTPYVGWLSATAARAEEAAGQARAAVAAYEAAFAMTVPPPVIAANRVLLFSLIATNFFGQNTPAIAAAEAHYMQMWAQDAVAMYGYAGSAATAAQVTPFVEPPQITSPGGLGAQSDAVTQANRAATDTAARAAAPMSAQLAIAAVPQALQGLASSSAATATGTSAASAQAALQQVLGAPTLGWLSTTSKTAIVRTLGLSYFGMGIPQFLVSIGQVLIPGAPSGAGDSGSSVVDSWGSIGGIGFLPAAGTGAPGIAPGWANWAEWSGLGGAERVSAGLGKSGAIGPMSVPPRWAESIPHATPTPGPAAVDVKGVPGPGAAALLRGIPLTGPGHGSAGYVHRYGFRHTVMPRPPAAG